jgi:hypothetical protein
MIKLRVAPLFSDRPLIGEAPPQLIPDVTGNGSEEALGDCPELGIAFKVSNRIAACRRSGIEVSAEYEALSANCLGLAPLARREPTPRINVAKTDASGRITDDFVDELVAQIDAETETVRAQEPYGLVNIEGREQ